MIDQKKKGKNNDPQNSTFVHRKLKIENHEPHKKMSVNSSVLE